MFYRAEQQSILLSCQICNMVWDSPDIHKYCYIRCGTLTFTLSLSRLPVAAMMLCMAAAFLWAPFEALMRDGMSCKMTSSPSFVSCDKHLISHVRVP